MVQFKGREMQHKELGRDLLQKIYQPIEDIAAMESPPKVHSISVTIIITIIIQFKCTCDVVLSKECVSLFMSPFHSVLMCQFSVFYILSSDDTPCDNF